MANSVDSDQMQHDAASDLGLHCLLRPVCPIRVNMVNQVFVQTDSEKILHHHRAWLFIIFSLICGQIGISKFS